MKERNSTRGTMPWDEDFLRIELNNEIGVLRRKRKSGKEDRIRPFHLIERMFAVEVFTDFDELVLEVATTERESHKEIRDRHSKTEPRISAELIEFNDLDGLRGLTLDPIVLEDGAIFLTRCERQLPEIVKWLLDKDIVPLDAECRLIDLETLPEIK